MSLYPAIDIKDGQCVRLKKGLFNEVTVYSDKPYEIAKAFEESGAQFIHTVDLDGALKGHGVNADTIKKIVNELNRRMLSESYISLNDFYYELGLSFTKMGDQLGWNVQGNNRN